MHGDFNPERIKALREGLGLTQIEFAQRLGVSNVTVNRWEHDHAHPRAPMIDRLLALESGARPLLPGVAGFTIGRDREIGDLRALIEPGRLITIIGPGGVGKTRLAIEAAAAMPAGFSRVCFVDLAVAADEAAVELAVTRALAIRETADEPLRDLIAGALRDQPLLVMLDNCEHVQSAAARIGAAVIGDGAQSVVLATSRIALGVRGEHRFPLRPLDHQAAIELFTERAAMKRPGFDPRANADAIAEICRRLDGLPLAIELAAARCALLTPREIADRLDRRFELLRTTDPAAGRWNTLDATIAWSCALLSPAEAQLFRGLSVFTGSFDPDAVEAVIDLPASLDLLEGLVNQSMVVIEQRPGDAITRYRLLESLLDYARRWAGETAEIAPIAARHARYYRELARDAAARLNTPDHRDGLARLDRNHDNIIAALEWTITHGAAREACDLAATLAPWWLRSSRLEAGARFLERAIGLAPEDESLETARAWNGFALIALNSGRQPQGQWAIQRALAITQAIGDRAGEAEALTISGRYLLQAGERDLAERAFMVGYEIRAAIGDRRGLAASLHNLGTIAGWKGDFATSAERYHQAWTHASATGDLATEAIVIANLGELTAHTGGYAHGLEYLDRALTIFRQFEDHDRIAAVLTNRAELCLLLGDYREAAVTSAQTVAQHRASRNRAHLANSLWVQGIALAAIGELTGAIAAFREGAKLEYELDDLIDIIYFIEAISRIVNESGDPELAARLLGGAARLRDETHAGDYEPFDYAGTISAVRNRLDDARFTTAWRAGWALSTGGLMAEASNLGRIVDGPPLRLYRQKSGSESARGELTPRQHEILRLAARGESNRAIADTLAISPRTVERHLTMIYDHFGVDRRSAAVAIAAERGLL